MKPMIDDVESFTLIDALGDVVICSRDQNKELFNLVVGGVWALWSHRIGKVRLALVKVLKREVKIIDVGDFILFVTNRIKEGYLDGNFQFSIDPKSKGFLRHGIYSLYKPVNQQVESSEVLNEMKDGNGN